MWHSISEHKNKHHGRQAIIVGSGPTADFVNELVDSYSEKPVLLGTNRSIMLRDDFDYIFVDHGSVIEEMEAYVKNTRYFCIPVFSRCQTNLNHNAVAKLQDKILLYAWVYEVEEILNAPKYPLNDELLYISWGCVPSAIHFARSLGIDDITMIGVDGGPINGQLYAKIIEKVLKLPKANREKRARDHAKTKSRLRAMADKAKVTLRVYGELSR